MATLLRFFELLPDLAAVLVLYGPVFLWARLKGEPIPDIAFIYLILTLIWFRLLALDWRRTKI